MNDIVNLDEVGIRLPERQEAWDALSVMSGDSVNSNPIRIFNLTSSQIHRLYSFGKREMTAEELAARPKKGTGSAAKLIEDRNEFGAGALTYIKEVNRSRKLGRSIKNDMSSIETDWGKVCERYVFENHISTEYSFTGDRSFRHPKIDFWSGSPDLDGNRKPKKIGEIKCPATLNSFIDFADCKNIDEVVELHEDGFKYVKQLESNVTIFDYEVAELIIFCPFQDELDAIRDLAREMGKDRIFYKKDDMELPFLIRGVSKYPNLLRFEFEVTDAMKSELTEIVLRAGEKLIQR